MASERGRPAAPGFAEDDTRERISKMVAFVKEEAQEKSHELRRKTKESIEIDSAKQLTEEKAMLDQEFQKRRKQVELEQRV